MPAEAAAMFDVRSALPMELRASLDLLFELLAGERGVMRTSVVGDPSLVTALGRFGTIEPDHDHSAFLGVPPREINETIAREQPRRVTVLGSGALERAIRPLRKGAAPVPWAPSKSWWNDRGYQLVRTIKVQGTGSLFWSACDRLLRRGNQAYLADRCRIAMLRTLVAARWPIVPATLRIQQYRRAT